MNQIFLNPMMYEIYKRQHEELIQQAAQYRQLKEAKRIANPLQQERSNFLAQVGKRLTGLGLSLVTRFGTTAEFQTTLRQQTNPGDCK